MIIEAGGYQAVEQTFTVVCPAHGGGFGDYDDDYEYVPGFRSDDPNPDQEPILIERAGNHNKAPGGYYVLYPDGHVERHTD